jgi:hypothetical protein
MTSYSKNELKVYINSKEKIQIETQIYSLQKQLKDLEQLLDLLIENQHIDRKKVLKKKNQVLNQVLFQVMILYRLLNKPMIKRKLVTIK